MQFDDFDAQLGAEEFYGFVPSEADWNEAMDAFNDMENDLPERREPSEDFCNACGCYLGSKSGKCQCQHDDYQYDRAMYEESDLFGEM